MPIGIPECYIVIEVRIWMYFNLNIFDGYNKPQTIKIIIYIIIPNYMYMYNKLERNI